MGAATSSLSNSVDWIRTQSSVLTTRQQQDGHQASRRRRQRQRARRARANRGRDVEANDRGSEDDADLDEDDFDSLEDDDDDANADGQDDNDDSLLEGEYSDSAPGQGGYDKHPLYFGPAFHPVTEQSPAQLQLQRQIEQQLEQQQRQEYWQQQYRQQHQQQQHQHQQQQQLSSLSTTGGQQLSLNDFILPSAISGLGGVNAGGGIQGAPGIPPSHVSGGDSVQEQLYRNSNLYNLISGLNVNALLTEVQRAGTLDLSVLEQELDDVEGGWMDIDEEEEEQGGRKKGDNNTSINRGQEGVVREMQPTKRSPTALACGVNLKKSTLRLVKNLSTSNDPSTPAPSHLRPNYRLDFSFDSLTPCEVKLFWVVKEVEEDGELGFRLRRLHHLPQPTTYHFPAGMNQRFISPILPLYTMSLPELTMQGLPSTSMRMFQRRNMKQWQQHSQADKDVYEDNDMDSEGENEAASRRDRKSKGRKKNGKGGKAGSDSYEKYAKKQGGRYPSMRDDEYKPIMEDQYFPLVILIEAVKEYKATGPLRSLPTPVADAPGLYLVDNQAISTFACFNISSEGGFEIKVMKQKVWINSTNYLIQEIFGFTDSVTSAPPTSAGKTANKETASPSEGTDKKPPPQSRSRLSRAESIASRVDELTRDRPKKNKSNKRSSQEGSSAAMGVSESRRTSKASMVTGLGIAEAESVARRSSVISMSAAKRNSVDSIQSSVSQTTSVNGAGNKSRIDAEFVADAEDEEVIGDQDEMSTKDDDEETAGQEESEANLVLLDAPECVICLSDVKDTVVLPCRHFCICSECGDVLRRRAPQRCPICRQVFQALLHIASTPARKPEFAMVPSPASTSQANPPVNGHSMLDHVWG
ncbi:hypothetical protein BGZ99_008878 [Dissophora globulifera]|uniref:RING-type domain-containing protein n=1 Tax=Dissophora globulifera TaxID=979702 RepID=A0A9P6RSS3_9FUNG|nr:hypothetical protein BGZ99_008878 [Dissophora globulifera]